MTNQKDQQQTLATVTQWLEEHATQSFSTYEVGYLGDELVIRAKRTVEPVLTDTITACRIQFRRYVRAKHPQKVAAHEDAGTLWSAALKRPIKEPVLNDEQLISVREAISKGMEGFLADYRKDDAIFPTAQLEAIRAAVDRIVAGYLDD